MTIRNTLVLSILLFFTSCKVLKDTDVVTKEIHSLHFIDELIIPKNLLVDGLEVGGLSAIDYYDGSWYVLSDDRKRPRYHIMDLPYSTKGFAGYTIKETHFFEDITGALLQSNTADPEALRVNSKGNLIWASEGDALKNIQPFIRKASQQGTYLDSFVTPSRYKFDKKGTTGPRHNGVFEALSLHYNSDAIWVATELPLLQDGFPPTSQKGETPVRIAFINDTTTTFKKEFVYLLDKVSRAGAIEVNGITEILSYAQDKLLVLERSYASGHEDGGNNVKIYNVSVANATDVIDLDALKDISYTAVTKTLLLDLHKIRSSVRSGTIDNIEGMAFGPRLPNGNLSLLLISDNNFNTFGKQLTQIFLFEVK